MVYGAAEAIQTKLVDKAKKVYVKYEKAQKDLTKTLSSSYDEDDEEDD